MEDAQLENKAMTQTKVQEEEEQFKFCPGCEVATEKVGGCSNMSCPNCKAKWCWICARKLRGKQLVRPLKRESRAYCDVVEHRPQST